MTSELETKLLQLTSPINGQYPRPWLTDCSNPAAAKVFTVGRNQRRGFLREAVEDLVGNHQGYVDALFNRGKIKCRPLYDQLTGAPSPTRINTDFLVQCLADCGVTDVIETNVICYSTPMSSDLRKSEHAGGKSRGTELFQTIFEIIKPRAVIAHGAGTAREVATLLGIPQPQLPGRPEATSRMSIGDTSIWFIPSLAPPAFNRWQRWSQDHLALVAREVADTLKI